MKTFLNNVLVLLTLTLGPFIMALALIRFVHLLARILE